MNLKGMLDYLEKKYEEELEGINVKISYLRVGLPGTFWRDRNLITINNGLLSFLPFFMIPLIIFNPSLLFPFATLTLYISSFSFLVIISTEAALMHELMHALIYKKCKRLKIPIIDETLAEALCEYEAMNSKLVSRKARIASKILHFITPMIFLFQGERDRVKLQSLIKLIESFDSKIIIEKLYKLKKVKINFFKALLSL
ncbi:MAG: hypothetical protein QXX95_02755 [Nitrososphaerales archaeon]